MPSKKRKKEVKNKQKTPKTIFWILTYLLLVLGVDSLAALHVQWPFPWRIFHWWPYTLYQAGRDWLSLPAPCINWLKSWPIQQFDLFKSLFWFLIPFAFSIRHMDWGYLGVKRWKKLDITLLLVLSVAGLLAVLLIPYVSALNETYPGKSFLSDSAKAREFIVNGLWVMSWLLGWEFLHRYVLLRQADARWPRFGWLLVPLSEGLYHLQKPGIEALGMVALSLILTYWARKRHNALLPFLVHLCIEFELILFLLLW